MPNSFRCITVQSLLPASLGDFSYLCCLMIYSKEHIDLLKRAIIECFGRTLDSPTDYDMLSADIRECTGETISSATLKRLFGYLKPSTAPRPSTLSVLARYVGYTGWSDFCQAQQTGPSESPDSIPGRKIMGIGVILVLGIVMFFVESKREVPITAPQILHTHDTVYIEHAVEIKDTTVHILTDEHRRYELALRYCIGTAKRQCDSVRARRSQMDILAYKNYVDSAYFAIAFDYMDKVIKRRMQEDFPGDSLLIMRYGNEIFAQCREVCVELMREIPIDELTSAARSEQNAQQ